MIGSTATGQRVIADSATSIKKLSMELGGNAPFIVFEDADIDKALDLAIGIKFGNSGQICVAANRFFVHKSLYNSFLEKYVERVKSLKLGFGIDQKPDMGPMVTRNDRDRMFDLINDAKEKGGVLLAGGEIPQGMKDGNWMMPTVISGMTTEMRLFREETFGPIAPFMSFETDEEVLMLANDTEFGLASYIFTNNSDRIHRFSEQLAFGEVQVNGVKYAIYLPHGGIKNSGIGHDCSHLALEDYLVKKRVSVAL
jgi:succinate-semialdehyde dehydrogenase/glutarate-semialdehyde dehydrogenase